MMRSRVKLVNNSSGRCQRNPRAGTRLALLLLGLAVACCHSLAAATAQAHAGDEQLESRRTRTELVAGGSGSDGLRDLRTLADANGNPSLADFGSEDTDRAWSAVGATPLPLRNEIYLLEDKDYPKSLFEDYPRRVGQVSGITTLPDNDVVIFHRSGRQWTPTTFNVTANGPRIATGKQDDLIKNDTIMIIDSEDGGARASFGSNLFYMPHSIASDQAGNLWVSDVARHQVMRLPVDNVRLALTQPTTGAIGTESRQVWPDLILGEAFVPGADEAHFCQPAEIAVSSRGRQLVFVADGYCNQRVMVFTASGRYLTSFGQEHNLTVVHSLALIEERNLLCVADRENGRILCYNAGLEGDLDQLGQLVHQVNYPLDRVFALISLSGDHLLVSSNQLGTNRYDLAILNPFTNELKLVWISTDLLEPHSLASTRDRQIAYAADISRDAYKKVFKFNIIKRRD